MMAGRVSFPICVRAYISRSIALFLLAGGGLGLTACSLDDESSNPTNDVDGKVTFTGPWASEFETYYEGTDSEFGRQALADSRITDQELQEASRLVEDCYTAKGYTVQRDQYGYAAAAPISGAGDDAFSVMGECEFADGGVQVLYYQMVVNPNNEDPLVLRAACLVDIGVVDPSFTGQDLEDLLAADDANALPWDRTDPQVQECMLNPAGQLNG
jgi:hypothetical protein